MSYMTCPIATLCDLRQAVSVAAEVVDGNAAYLTFMQETGLWVQLETLIDI